MKNPITYGSVCSGIEAATVAWHPLGWRALWFAEIEAFPSAALAHHYPDVPNLGDMTKIAALVRSGEVHAPDVLVGGTPCQAFSVAGLRGGLSDPRGALTLAYVNLANEIDSARSVRGDAPCVTTWENVPGVLSSKDNAFGCFLGALAGESCELEPEPRPAPGKSSRHWRWDKKSGAHAPSWPLAGCVIGPQRSIAWRVLDAQYFGVAQRRRRVFVVASARKGFDPAAVLFEWEGLRRDSAPSREAGQETAGDAGSGAALAGGDGGVVSSLDASYGRLQGCSGQDMNHGHSHLVPTAFGGNRTSGPIDITPALLAQGGSGYKGDFESETFLVGPAGTLRRTDGGADVDHALAGHLVPCVTGDVTHTLKAEGFDASEDGTGRGRGTPIVPVAVDIRNAALSEDGPTMSIQAGGISEGRGMCINALPHVMEQPVAFDTTQITSKTNRCNPQPGDPCHPLAAGGHPPAIAFPANLSGTQCASAEDLAPALGAKNPTAVAHPVLSFKPGQSEAAGGIFVTEDFAPTLQAMNNGSTAVPAVAVRASQSGVRINDTIGTLDANYGSRRHNGVMVPVAYTTKLHNTASNQAGKVYEEYTTSLDRSSPPPALLTAMQVRRLTPRECERLQSFPDDYTRIPNWSGWRKLDEGETPEQLAAEGLEVKQNKKTGRWSVKDVDGPRYKALGNSMCVYNMRWIGRRIDAHLASLEAAV